MVEKRGGMNELAKICPNCGKQNKITSKFCENCETALNEVLNTSEQDNIQKSEQSYKPASIFDQIKGFWNTQDTKSKAVKRFAMCCLGVLIIGAFIGALSPEKTIAIGFTNATYDSPGEYHVDINNSTTEYVILGHTENVTNLTVSSTDLNINAQKVNLTSDNWFTYKIKIPANVTSAKVRFDAVQAGKENTSVELIIKKVSPVSNQVINTNSTSTTPKTVTITQLYASSIPIGTYVKVTGTVLQSDEYNLRIENSAGKDILVQGSDLSAYEDQSVTVVGTFYGPSSYTTVMGSERTIPTITDAKIV